VALASTAPTPSAHDQAQALAGLRSRPQREHQASFVFWDPAFGCASVKVLPGEFYVHDQDVAITTTLGSCVAACLHDPGAGVGGMNHFMLPDAGDAAAGGRFGAFAMELLINELLKRGARRGSLQAKVFGGGQVMKSLAGTLIGEKNVAFVTAFLAQERIPVLGKDVLDIYPRKVCLFPKTGKALCRRLPAAQVVQAEAQEAKYRAELVRQPSSGAIELF
jgi:chemotaxis protein CheD